MNTRDAMLLSALYENLKSIRDAWEQGSPLDHLIRSSAAILARAERETSANQETS